MSDENEDVSAYFSKKEWNEITDYEKKSIVGRFQNYIRMKNAGKMIAWYDITLFLFYHSNLNLLSLFVGLHPVPPEFMKEKQKKGQTHPNKSRQSTEKATQEMEHCPVNSYGTI